VALQDYEVQLPPVSKYNTMRMGSGIPMIQSNPQIARFPMDMTESLYKDFDAHLIFQSWFQATLSRELTQGEMVLGKIRTKRAQGSERKNFA